MPIDYVRDVPADDEMALELETAHVRAQLSAIAEEDDDPETNADDVQVFVRTHPEDPDQLRIVGLLEAEPNAPYLRPDYDPLAEVAPDLYATEVAAAEADLEVLHGQA